MLDWAGGLAEGGDSGSLLEEDEPLKSFLLQVIRHEDSDMKMPKGGPKLSPEVIEDFEKWVAAGVPDPRKNKPSKEEIAKATSWYSLAVSCFWTSRAPIFRTTNRSGIFLRNSSISKFWSGRLKLTFRVRPFPGRALSNSNRKSIS